MFKGKMSAQRTNNYHIINVEKKTYALNRITFESWRHHYKYDVSTTTKSGDELLT